MVSSDSASEDANGTDRGVNRRTVLKGLGTGATGAVAGIGLVGTARGHEVQGKPVFCGCSQLCVCMEGNGGILMAQENDEGGYDVGFLRDGELVPYPEGESPYSGNFCVSTDDENVPDGKIIGLQVDGTRWVNPNQCAQKALDAEQAQLDSTHPRPEGESGGPCGEPPCEHPSNGKGDGNDAAEDEFNIEFEMDDRNIMLADDNEPVSRVTITGFAEFSYAGWEEDGVDHAFITSWAQSDADIDFPDRDIQRYFDVDSDTDTVTKDIEISFDVPPEVGDPESGEAIETEITGHLFVGLEHGSDPEESESIMDARDNDPMVLTVERE